MNYQRKRWDVFFRTGIYDMFEEYFKDLEYCGFKISATPDPSQITSLQRQGSVQETAPLYVDWKIQNINSKSGVSDISYPAVKLMDIPLFAEDGFKGKNSTEEAVSRLIYASGWYIDVADKNTKTYKTRLIYRGKYGRVFYITDTGKVYSARNNNNSIPIMVFLKAVTGYSFDRLLLFYKDIPNFIDYIFTTDEIPYETACKETIEVLRGAKDISLGTAANTLNNWIYGYVSIRAGEEKIPRYLDMESWHRCHGMRIISAKGEGASTLKADTVITTEIAERMDKQYKITECTVRDESGKEHVIKRCYAEGFTNSLTPNEILYAYYQYLLYMNGIGSIHDGQELSNLILEPMDKICSWSISSHLNDFVESIIANINADKFNPLAGLENLSSKPDRDKNKNDKDIISIISSLNSNRTADITNTVSEVDLAGKVKRENSNAQRDVHYSHYGRLDMNDTPESEEVGLTISLCSHSDIDRYGFITVPLYKVENGKTDRNKTVMLSYLDEKWQYIAPVDCNLDNYQDNELVPNCTLNGKIVSAVKKLITYQRRQSEDYYGSTLNAVPGVTWNGTKRFTLASSAFKQACPLMRPERPYLSTGFAKNDTGVIRTQDVITEYFASLGKRDIHIPKNITIQLKEWEQTDKVVEATFELSSPIEGVTIVKYVTLGMTHSINKTMREYKLTSSSRDHQYVYNEIVLRSNDINISRRDVEAISTPNITDHDYKRIADHDIALGQNLRVLYKTFKGFGYEDSVILNRRFVDNYGLATVSTVTIKSDNKKHRSGKKKEFSAMSDCENSIYVDWIDSNGLPKIGTYLKPGDIVIGCVLKDKDGKKDTKIPAPERLSATQEGYVWYATKRQDPVDKYDIVEVVLARVLPLDIGDKITGGHGNKATCSKILEDHEMPYMADGTTPDIIFDPLGCIARENVGQITECLLAEIGRHNNKTMIVNQGIPLNPDELVEKAESCGIGLQTIYNPETGEPYKEKCFIGTMHIVRSTHTCFSKYMAMGSSKGKISKDGQPIKKGAEHAQRISELTSWCYRASGAEKVLNSLFSTQSDDLPSRDKLIDAIRHGEEFNGEYESVNGYRLQAYLRFFGINMDIDDNNASYLEPISSDHALELAGPSQVIALNTLRDNNTLNDPEIFGDENPDTKNFKQSMQKYGLIQLSGEMISPIFMNNKEFTRSIPVLKKIIKDNKSRVVFEGLKPTEVSLIFSNKYYFGTVCEPVKADLYNGFTTEFYKVFFMTNDKTIAEDYNAEITIGTGIEHFFNIISDDSLYDLHRALEIYRAMYGSSINVANQSESYKEALFNAYKTEDNISNKEELSDMETLAEVDEYITSVDAGTILSEEYADVIRLEEMLESTGYTLKSFMSKYVIVPPSIFRPISEEDNVSYRAFSRALHKIITSKGKVGDVYRILENELKPPKKGSKAKTIISELTAHKNKTSIIRDKCLAKTVSYSGRSVISVDPTLKLGECKIPAIMLTTIFMEHLQHMIEQETETQLYKTITSNSKSKTFPRERSRILLNGIVNCDLDSAVNKLKIIDDFMSTSGALANNTVRKKQALFDTMKHELYDMLSDLADKHPAILSRDPALWEFSVRGFRFIPSNGYTIRIHPLVCKGFNADFDGDQMSAVFPMHKEAKKVLGEHMMVGSTLINPQDGVSIFAFEQDILMGHFYATQADPEIENISEIVSIKNTEEYIDRYKCVSIMHLYDKIEMGIIDYSATVVAIYKNRKYLTTVGRLMFNLLYPASYTFTENKSTDGDFYDLRFKTIDKTTSNSFTEWVLLAQKDIESAMGVPIEKLKYMDIEKAQGSYFMNEWGVSHYVMEVADRLMSFGFFAADMSGTTLSYWDFANLRDSRIEDKIIEATHEAEMITTRERLGLLDAEMAKARLRDIWGETQKFSEDVLSNNLEGTTNLFNMIKSGARGSIANLNHICGFIGTVVNASGEEMPEPIKGNYLNGLSNEDVSINSFDNRRIKLHTQGGSSDSGEKTRKLVYILEHFKTGETKTCNTTPTELKLHYVPSLDVKGTVLFNDEPTEDMTAEEKTAWNEFIKELHRLGLVRCFSDYVNNLLFNYDIDYVSIQGNTFKQKLKWKLEKEYRNMLWYRTFEPTALRYICTDSMLDEIKSASMRDFTLDPVYTGHTNRDLANYIYTHEAISLIEKYKLPYVNLYTMINCKNDDGTICPRCFGYRYQDCKYPESKEPIGYTVAGSIGQRGVQAAQNLHKAGSGNKKTINIYSENANLAFTNPGYLNSKVCSIMDDIDEIETYYYRAIETNDFKFGKSFTEYPTLCSVYKRLSEETGITGVDNLIIHLESEDTDISASYGVNLENDLDEFKDRLASVAKFDGVVGVHKLNNTIVLTVYNDDDFIWFPIWNEDIEVAVTDGQTVCTGDPLIRMPALYEIRNICNTSTGDVAKKSQSEIALQMWYTTLKTLGTGGFAARNFELTTKAFNETGISLQNRYQSGIVEGRIYPIHELEKAGVDYKIVIPSDFHLGIARGKVLSSIAKGHFALKAAQCAVRRIKNDKNSSISDALAGIDRDIDSYPKVQPVVAIKNNDIGKIVNSVVESRAAIQNALTGGNANAMIEENASKPREDISTVVHESGIIEIIPNEDISYEVKQSEIEIPTSVIEVMPEDIKSDIEAERTNVFDEIDLLLEEGNSKGYPAQRKNKNKNKKQKDKKSGETSLF